jgi:hypothetical protein
MPSNLPKNEQELQRAIKRAEREILKIYEQTIFEISIAAAGVKLNGKPFSLSFYPALENYINSQVDKMHQKILSQIVKSVKKSWAMSNIANDLIVDKRLAGKVATKKARQILYDPNLPALNQFLVRKEKGLNLSSRVWNLTKPFKKEMEQALGLGISKGQSAAKLATEMKSFLHEPDRLFRRVRSEEGKLVLSRAAREYNPGQGVYRSSYKNALRLTATETNISYRSADHERWKNLPFVIGMRVKTSNNHPEFDICDECKGLYPKDFKFVGWHPFCRCYSVAEMMSDADYNKIEDQVLAGEPVTVPKRLLVSKPPKGFSKFLSDNRERIEGWSKKPYWMKDNKKYTK